MRALMAVGVTVIAVAYAPVALAAAHVGTLTGTVGPGFNITMSKKKVTPGKYTITVKDLSSIHDFHLTGPGVNKATTVPGTGTTKWTVTLKKGTYNFVCDPHRSFMHGTLTVT